MVQTPSSDSRQLMRASVSMPSPSSYNDENGAQSCISEPQNNQSVTIKGGVTSESEANTSVDVIDHMARLDFRIKPEGGTLISFHYEYNDYLDELGCVDPSALKESKKHPEVVEPHPVHLQAQTVGGDLELEDCDDTNQCDVGQFRFENVLKSMVARLELYNNLAPIQEYARHQTKASKKRKTNSQAQQASKDENSNGA